MASPTSNTAVKPAPRAAQPVQQQPAPQKRDGVTQASPRAIAQKPLDTRAASALKPRLELFRADTFTQAGGRAPVQLDGGVGATLSAKGPAVSAAFTGTTGPGRAAGADEQKVLDAENRARELGGTLLAEDLRSDDLSAEDKRALIDRIINGGNAGDILSNFDHAEEERNYDYDDATTVATAIADAYRSGVVTDEELRSLAEDLGPERSAELAAQLALDPENTHAGGVVEAFGRQARDLGYEQAAALAFSSSQELIAANLPSAAEQRAAFDDVKAYLGSQDRDDLSNEQQAFYSIAAGNAVRLSANGNGFSDSELQDFVEDLGPSLAGEVIARARNTPGDSGLGGTVEKLGLAARAIAGDDVSGEWALNSAVALTASRELIDTHLQGRAGLEAFRTLSEAAYNQYDTAADAKKDGYNLLRFPEITEGAAALFEARTDDIVQAAITSGEGVLDEGHLDRFLQSTLFSPFTSAEQKQQVQGALKSWSENHVKVGPDQNEGEQSFELGKVFGIVQNAADAAVNRVGDDAAARAEAENEAKGFIASLGSSIIGTALGAYNPLLGAIGGPVAQKLIEEVLPEEDIAKARADAEEEFKQLLADQGVHADLGQALKEMQEMYLRKLQDAIINQLQSNNLTQEQRNQLDTASEVLGNIRDSLDDGYGSSRPQ